jgi:uncharacterized protein
MASTPPPSEAAATQPPTPPGPTPPPPPPAVHGEQPPWPVWTAPAAVALGFAFGIFLTIFVGIFAAAGGSSLSHPTPAVSLISDVMFDLAFVLAAIYLAALRFHARPADFGFRRVPIVPAAGVVVLAAIGYYVLTSVYATVFKLHGTDKLPNELGVSSSTAALVGATVFVCVLAPMAEEFFFRGFVFGALRNMRIKVGERDIGTWVAAVITGILFGLAHTGSANAQFLIPLGFLGFVLCLVRWRTGSLYPCMALHSLNNSLALGVDQLHWSAGEILALMIGSIAVIAAITVPIAGRAPAFR